MPVKRASPPRRTAPPSIHPHHVADAYQGMYAAAFMRACKTLIPDLDSLTRGIARGVVADAMASIEDLASFKHRLAAETLPPTQAIMAMRGREAMQKLTPIAKAAMPLLLGSSFSLTNPYAIQAAQSIVGDMVTGVSEETIDAIRSAIAQSIENGIPPRQAAKYISSLTGLNGPQTATLAKFRQGLVDSKLPLGKVESMTSSYGARLLQQRGLLIARTETIRASVAGTQAGWQQAIQQGQLDSQTMGQVWIDTEDERTCPDCTALAASDPIPFGEQFEDGQDGPPDHPGCRCDVGVATLPTPLAAAPASAFGDTSGDVSTLDESGQPMDGTMAE